MKILTISGSPKKNGKTATVLDSFEDNLLRKGYSIQRINLSELNGKGCLGCYACIKNESKSGCVQKDDLSALLEQMINADAIVYASPIYGFDITAQMKTFLDRHFSLITGYRTPAMSSMIAGKPTALMITCGGKVEENADLALAIFDRVFDKVLKCKVMGKYVIPFSGAPDFEARAAETAKKMASDIIRS